MELSSTPHAFTLTLLTADRPGLFATVAGVLAGWSMNIVKAEAFANSAGIILDTFHFTDPSRTFEMNPGEIDRFQDDLESVVCRNRRCSRNSRDSKTTSGRGAESAVRDLDRI